MDPAEGMTLDQLIEELTRLKSRFHGDDRTNIGCIETQCMPPAIELVRMSSIESDPMRQIRGRRKGRWPEWMYP